MTAWIPSSFLDQPVESAGRWRRGEEHRTVGSAAAARLLRLGAPIGPDSSPVEHAHVAVPALREGAGSDPESAPTRSKTMSGSRTTSVNSTAGGRSPLWAVPVMNGRLPTVASAYAQCAQPICTARCPAVLPPPVGY